MNSSRLLENVRSDGESDNAVAPCLPSGNVPECSNSKSIMADSATTRIDNATAPCLPSGNVIDCKNTLDSHSVMTDSVVTKKDGAVAPPRLPSGNVIDCKNTLDSHSVMANLRTTWDDDEEDSDMTFGSLDIPSDIEKPSSEPLSNALYETSEQNSHSSSRVPEPMVTASIVGDQRDLQYTLPMQTFQGVAIEQRRKMYTHAVDGKDPPRYGLKRRLSNWLPFLWPPRQSGRGKRTRKEPKPSISTTETGHSQYGRFLRGCQMS